MPRIPAATYRLQLHKEFTFDSAAAIADYIEALGISHVYCSPYLQAAPDSKHGYDVVDHHRVNEELGGGEAHDRFCKHLGECHLGQVLDIVPNHMAISGRRNRLWWDVLENGPSSRYSPYFDINWSPRDAKLQNKLLVPILGDHYGRVLARGELKLKRKQGEFVVQYYETELPAAPRSLPPILSAAAEATGSDYLAFLANSLFRLPKASVTDAINKAERHRDKAVIQKALERLFRETPFIAEAVDNVLDELNRNADRLDAVLEQQNFRLAFWQTAKQDLPYRRFFDVNTLVALNTENMQVFCDTHALILRWLREGVLDGIRIDHPDGLAKPREYFERLRSDAPDVWIVAEKILEPGEALRREWPIDGTTGYDFMNEVAGLFVDTDNEEEISRIYSDFTGLSTDYVKFCRDMKHTVLRDLLGSDVNRLSQLLYDICESHRDQRDYTRHDVLRAVREVIACFPVYRTYVVPSKDEITADDERYTVEAIDAARNNRPELDSGLFDFIRELLLLKVRGDLESEFVVRFQQFCGPAMAKGVEDTVFYAYNRLTSLNEVGGDPGRFGVSPENFHRFNTRTQAEHPRSMLGTSTHDTKRSEEVRVRISLLSEMPSEWKQALARWSELNRKYKTKSCPDANTEYFLYQTMLGAWPIELDRLLPYMEKACREAKQQTSWLAPNEAFETATKKFVQGIYADAEFRRDFEAFAKELEEPGWLNSLSQTLLKFTSPGIPDTYQGEEIWDLSLVDPDNRRPVDYGKRRELLSQLAGLTIKQIWDRRSEGLPKLWIIQQALRLRKERPDNFGPQGSYRAMEAKGSKAKHFVGYERGEGVVIAGARLHWQLQRNWADTVFDLPPGDWNNRLDGKQVAGGEIKIAELLREFPVALLVKAQ